MVQRFRIQGSEVRGPPFKVAFLKLLKVYI